MSTLSERKIEGAPYEVCLDEHRGVLTVTLYDRHDFLGTEMTKVYQGPDSREALDAFEHPFVRPHVPDIFKRDVAGEAA
jgi:hypothetical protein